MRWTALACLALLACGQDETVADTDDEVGDSEAESESGDSDEESSESDEDSSGSTDEGESGDSDEESSESDDGGTCRPGESICVDGQNGATCTEAGEWGPPFACEADALCSEGVCVNECEFAAAQPSSIGCSFVAAKMDNYYSNVEDPLQHDALVAGNTSQTKVTNVQLWHVPIGGASEEPVGAPVVIEPRGTHTFVIDEPEIDSISLLRLGGLYRLESTLPIVAYQHSPLESEFTNDSSMLLPESALTGNYVIASYPALAGPHPSQISIIGLVDGSLVEVEARESIAAGEGVPEMQVGEIVEFSLDRHSLLNLVAAEQQGGDLSGTLIRSSAPLHVMSGVEAANVPDVDAKWADHLEEAMLPLEYWGSEYVCARAPARAGGERWHWRLYSGSEGVTISSEPLQAGLPVTLDEGEFVQIETDEDFVLSADGPVMPVQYLEGASKGGEYGDPSMILSVPTEQFLSSYAFVTGIEYWLHYAQIVRPIGGAEVFVDEMLVGDYVTVGNYEIADVAIEEGAHFATSAEPFGIAVVGYTTATSYGYPGGMRLSLLNPQ